MPHAKLYFKGQWCYIVHNVHTFTVEVRCTDINGEHVDVVKVVQTPKLVQD